MNARVHKQRGFRRLLNALGHQYAGSKHALANDPAIRQVGAGVAILIIVSIFLHVGVLEHLLLAVVTAQVLLFEVINSAIEATVDRISQEQHPLAREAKDLGSVAVGLAVLIASSCWLVICWPLVAGLLPRMNA